MSRWLFILATCGLLAVGGGCGSESSDEIVDGVTLRVEVHGWGDVTPLSGTYERDSLQTLTATAHTGWVFAGWSGATATVEPSLDVTLDDDTTVVATFREIEAYPGWTGTAVRKVLQTFAWGGFPTDEQVSTWAAMEPEVAIQEMLTFAPTNDKLSPPDFDTLGEAVAGHIPEGGGQLEGIAHYFSTDPDERIDSTRRAGFELVSPTLPEDSWEMAIRARGVNTFLHRVGFWETNYHMSMHPNLVVPHPMIRHYDNIVGELIAGSPYHEVVGQGALNAATAYQYGHNYNLWHQGEFLGNEDFAREFHQLFFGILGDPDFGGEAYHQDHELVSIKNTAKMLTGIKAYYLTPEAAIADLEIDFDAELVTHHVDPLTILDETISGANAKEKIEALAAIAIDHPESEQNLPVMVVGGLADDNLTPEKIEAIRAMWTALPEKNLLTFLQSYAVSSLFHAGDRVRYHTSFDRTFFIHNRLQLGNHELYMGEDGLNPLYYLLLDDLLVPFHPVHSVFGHQNSLEAFNNADIFKNAYNRSSKGVWFLHSAPAKDWQHTIPRSADGQWLVKDVARFLWQRFVADGLKNYGPLEEAHLYALLGSQIEERDARCVDLGLFLDPEDPERFYTVDELQSEPQLSRIAALGEQTLPLDETDWGSRVTANSCIQRALSFIAATPYVFLQEGH